MNLTQFLIFEISDKCQLGDVHPACPNKHADRYRLLDTSGPLTDKEIVDIAAEMYMRHGFRGCIGWHYYNEPLLSQERILILAKEIKERVPEARFVLWTNGGHGIDINPACIEAHDYVMVTDYGSQYAPQIGLISSHAKNLKVMKAAFDARLHIPRNNGFAPCKRPFVELVVDYYGNVHLCCHDWLGEVGIGNVKTSDLSDIVDRWRNIRNSISGRRMLDTAPERCLSCGTRHNKISSFVPEIAAQAEAHCAEPVFEAVNSESSSCCLLIVCIGEPSPSWIRHHENVGKVYVAQDASDAYSIATRKNAYFCVALKPYQTLCGPVKEALSLHPNEAILEVPINRNKEEVGILNIVRHDKLGAITDAGACAAGRRLIRVRMNELHVVDSYIKPGDSRAVVFVHYKIPEKRLREHFAWNESEYLAAGTKVFVVADRQYDVPEYARCLVYPGEMPVFNLALTSNFGIRHAITAGHDVIVKTDADMVFDGGLGWMFGVKSHSARIPMYRMASSYKDREQGYVDAPNATGTICMRSECWQAAHFNEECVGYGCDDGILMRQIKRCGYSVERAKAIYHIAHIEGTPQKEFDRQNPRIDHWNRDSGFNPENFVNNRQLDHAQPTGEHWGLRDYSDIAVVVSAYRIDHRVVKRFVDINTEVMETARARLVLVTDKALQDNSWPAWVVEIVYPSQMEMFSLSRTSNYGIRRVGRGTICKADIDLVLSDEFFDIVGSVRNCHAVCPVYRMANTQGNGGQIWYQSKGCIAMRWVDWSTLCGYDERMVGYGYEDSDLFQRAQDAGITISRDVSVVHIAHSESAQHNRADRHNRSFNPLRVAHNKAIAGAWARDEWGLACVE